MAPKYAKKINKAGQSEEVFKELEKNSQTPNNDETHPKMRDDSTLLRKKRDQNARSGVAPESSNKKKKDDSGSDEDDDGDDVDYGEDSHSDASVAEIKASSSKQKKVGQKKQEGQKTQKKSADSAESAKEINDQVSEIDGKKKTKRGRPSSKEEVRLLPIIWAIQNPMSPMFRKNGVPDSIIVEDYEKNHPDLAVR